MAENKVYRVKEKDLKNIADAIREKRYNSVKLEIESMPDAIRAIETPIPEGYIKPEGTLEITEGGEHDVTQYAKVMVGNIAEDLTDVIAEQEALIAELAEILEGKSNFEDLTAIIEEQERLIAELNALLENKTNVEDLTAIIAEQEALIAELRELLESKSDIEDLTEVVAEQERIIAELNALLESKKDAIIPEGTLEVFDNGEYDVAQYEKVNVLIGVAGLYDENDVLLASWDKLVNEYGLELRDSSLNTIISSNSQLSSACKFIISDDVTSIGNSAFRNCTSLESVEIPNSVTSIGEYAFKNCTKLLSIEIPENVKSIGGGAFESCKKLKNITIPNGVTRIWGYTFTGCENLENITIPSSVTNILESAFEGCESLVSAEIPNSVTSIDEYAFGDCSNLTIYCEAESQPTGWDPDWNPDDRPVIWGATMSYTLKITENGKFDVIDYSDVNVNVPIPEGYIKPEGVLKITTNGEIDVKTYEKVNVDISSGVTEEEVEEIINTALEQVLEGDC